MIQITDRLHADYRPTAEAQIAALAQEHPMVPLKALTLYDPEPGDRSLGHCYGDGEIVLSAYWFAEPRAKLDAAIARGREAEPKGAMAWHGRIGGLDGEFSRLLCHEFGHLLADVTPGALRFAQQGYATALADPALAVSGYALVDRDEWWAETFAALRMGGAGQQPTQMATFLVDAANKKPQASVQYEARAGVPDRRCGLCANFAAPDACSLVVGPVSPRGWCTLFERSLA